jgi:[acyl-carrier-protein] S-malonyltransferase
MIAGLFPGQGVATRAILEALLPGDPVLEVADEVLGYDLRSKVEKGARLTVLPTRIAQPAIFVASLISSRTARDGGIGFSHLIGHSLGEYAALTTAKAFSFRDGLRVVSVRGEAMDEAVRNQPGGMVALIGPDHEALTDIAAKAGVAVANDNSPRQIVVAGQHPELESAASMARCQGARALRLSVEAPFHTVAMSSAKDALSQVLSTIEVRSPKVPVISNVTARPYRSPGEVRRLLVEQLTAPVRFRESVEFALGLGALDFVDLGPGEVVGPLAAQTTEGNLNGEVAHV